MASPDRQDLLKHSYDSIANYLFIAIFFLGWALLFVRNQDLNRTILLLFYALFAAGLIVMQIKFLKGSLLVLGLGIFFMSVFNVVRMIAGMPAHAFWRSICQSRRVL